MPNAGSRAGDDGGTGTMGGAMGSHEGRLEGGELLWDRYYGVVPTWVPLSDRYLGVRLVRWI